jgi:hypothetical protein
MLTTPINEKGDLQFHDLDENVNNGEDSPQWEDAMRYWDGHDQQGKSTTLSTLMNILISAGGYISFPDFENFVQQHEHENDSRGEQQRSNS